MSDAAEQWAGSYADICRNVMLEVEAKTDLKLIVERHVELRSAGAGVWRGACPWCKADDKFVVMIPPSRTLSFTHCLACREHRTAVGFMMKIDGRDFLGSLGSLAIEAGIDWQSVLEALALRSAS